MKRPALAILVPFCLGIFAATFLNPPFIYPFLSGVVLIASSFFLRAQKACSHIALYAALLFLGMASYLNAALIPSDDVARLVPDRPRMVFIKGAVVSDPGIERTRFGGWRSVFTMRAAAVRAGPSGEFRRSSGLIAVRAYTKERRAFVYGDEVVLQGALSRPVGLHNPGTFDYEKYLALRNIYSSLKVNDRNFIEIIAGGPANPVARLAYRLRGKARSVLDRYLAGPDNAFVKAILIGERSALGDDINDDFIRTGTVHILSISGLHVALLASAVLALFGLAGVPRNINLVMTMALLIVYAFVAGSSAPIVRSVIMFFIVAFGYMLGRQTDTINSIAAAAFLILIWSPKALLDPGFQLSFVSVASMVVLAPKIASRLGADTAGRALPRSKIRRYLITGVSVSLAAWIGTMPIVLSYFNMVSVVSIAANLVIVPVSLASMCLAIALVFLSPVSGFLASACAFAVGAVDSVLFSINHLLAHLPGGSFRASAPGAGYIISYYALVFLWAWSHPVPDGRRAWPGRRTAIIAILFVLNILTWRDCLAYNGGQAMITFLDVGLGDAAFIEFPDGENLLIDAGPGGGEALDAGRHVIAPYLWNRGVRRIDTVIISHPHQDHVGGMLYLFENFKVGTVADSGIAGSGSLVDGYLRALRSSGARHIRIGAGDVMRFSCGAEFFVVSPGRNSDYADENANSVVGKLVYGPTSALFCGDVTSVAMDRAIDTYGDFLKSDIIKVPHHGGIVGDESTVNIFFNTVDPETAVISTSRERRYDWRKGNIATYLPAICYDTSVDGAIVMTLNGSGVEAETFVDKP